jgi:hypothetical protein
MGKKDPSIDDFLSAFVLLTPPIGNGDSSFGEQE